MIGSLIIKLINTEQAAPTSIMNSNELSAPVAYRPEHSQPKKSLCLWICALIICIGSVASSLSTIIRFFDILELTHNFIYIIGWIGLCLTFCLMSAFMIMILHKPIGEANRKPLLIISISAMVISALTAIVAQFLHPKKVLAVIPVEVNGVLQNVDALVFVRLSAVFQIILMFIYALPVIFYGQKWSRCLHVFKTE